MKRLIVVLVLICGIVGACLYSEYYVRQVKQKVYKYTNAVFISIDAKNGQEAREGVNELVAYWEDKAPAMARFIRHTHLDEVSIAVAKLESFSKYESFSELRAELGVIVWMMEELWQSERLTLGNILSMQRLHMI